jgi:hypothetical protein
MHFFAAIVAAKMHPLSICSLRLPLHFSRGELASRNGETMSLALLVHRFKAPCDQNPKKSLRVERFHSERLDSRGRYLDYIGRPTPSKPPKSRNSRPPASLDRFPYRPMRGRIY